MENSDVIELTYLPDEPDMETLKRAYEGDTMDASQLLDKYSDAYDQRNCNWPNKSRTQRKDYRGAKPWVGASDQEVPLIEYAIDTSVEIKMNAYHNGSVMAIPVGSDDAERAAVTSQFIRWAFDSWIPNADREMELAANHMDEKMFAITYVGWERVPRRHEEEIDIDDIAKVSPDLAELLMDEDADEDEIFSLLRSIPNVKDIPARKARKAIKELRKAGVSKIPVLMGDINRPVFNTKSPEDVRLPYYTTDPQRAPRMHVREFMSAQGLLKMVFSEKWDKDVVDEIIKNHMGISASEFDGPFSRFRNSGYNGGYNTYGSLGRNAQDIVVIERTMQRFVDPEDGAIAIYETVWCPAMGTKRKNGKPAYLKFQIMNGWDEYPVAFTRYKEANKRWADVRGLVDTLRGSQRQAKVTRDGDCDARSLRNSPPRTHRAGAPVQRWGADADIPIRRGDEGLYKYLEVPNNAPDNINTMKYIDEEVDRYMGFTPNSPIALIKLQAKINKFLSHVGKCARLMYKAYQKYGDDEIHFRVTGSPDPITISKSPYEEELDVRIVFDSRLTQPDYVSEIIQGMDSMIQSDRTGRVDPDAYMDIKAALLVPQYAGRLLRPKQAAQEDIEKRVSDDLAKLQAKIPVNANTQGYQIALEFLDLYQSQPDVQEQLATDIGFAQRYGAYREQYEREAQQAVNADIGRNINPNAMVQSEVQ